MDEAIYPIAKNPNKSLLTAAGVGWCDLQYHCIRKDGYPQPQINYCTEGKGVLVTEGKTTEITKGMSFFSLPMCHTNTTLWAMCGRLNG